MMLRLASPMLPIGGFSYSQGLEQAIELGWVSDEASTARWLEGLLDCCFARFEVPLLYAACSEPNRLPQLNQLYIASRESLELRNETLQMGHSLLQLLKPNHVLPAWALDAQENQALCLPAAWALAAQCWQVQPQVALQAYLFAWLENQILAALKTVPLGQQAGQRLLDQLLPKLDALVDQVDLPQDEWSNGAPGLAMASSWHEIQYSRMFRS
jgi:urease accessory protein